MLKISEQAFAALKEINAPVIKSQNDYGAHFIISAEDNVKEVWADYYDGMNIPDWEFGVNPKITKILTKFGLFAEWINPGMLGVYPI